MADLAGGLAAFVMGALAALHIRWALRPGASSEVVVPTRDGKPLFHPSRTATLIVALLLTLAAVIALGARGWLGLGGWRALCRIGCWGVAAVLLARAVGDFRWIGFFKKPSASRFALWDTRLFSPLCLLLALAFLAVGTSPPSL